MAEKNQNGDFVDARLQLKKKNRGTSDELEILTQIITENNILLNKVLEKVYATHPSVNPRNNPQLKKPKPK